MESSRVISLYLKSKLSGDGEAPAAVANLDMENDSYHLVEEILDKRYNNKRKLLEVTIQMIKDDHLSHIPEMTPHMSTIKNERE